MLSQHAAVLDYMGQIDEAGLLYEDVVHIDSKGIRIGLGNTFIKPSRARGRVALGSR